MRIAATMSAALTLLMTALGSARAAGPADAMSPRLLAASQDYWRSQPPPDDPTERYLRPLAKSPAPRPGGRPAPAARPAPNRPQSAAAAGGAASNETQDAVDPDSPAAPQPWLIGLLVAGGLIVAGIGGVIVIGRRRRRRMRGPRAAAFNVPRGHTPKEDRTVSEPKPGAGRRAA